MNIWEKILDNYIYPIIMSHIATTMNEYLNTTSRFLQELDNYLGIMATEGYSCSNTNGYKRKYKSNIENLKLLFNKFN